MKLVSWNVNGFRSVVGKGFMDFVEMEQPDILCLQETKIHTDQMPDLDWAVDYHQYWQHAISKKGYSGTAILTKEKPINVTYGIGLLEHDQEGRVITAEYSDFYLVNVYTPNSKRDLLRLEYRTQVWDVLFLKYLKNLEKKKPVIFCGDLNVAHKDIDLKNPKNNTRNAGFTIEERTSFDNIIESGFVDTFREFESGGGHYTWWSYMPGVREKNVGWRIDYFLISPDLRHNLHEAYIQPHVMGSDHCPVGINISI
jgi:exodeoxyribonuclease-3